MHDGYKIGFFSKTPSLDCLEMHQNSSRVFSMWEKFGGDVS